MTSFYRFPHLHKFDDVDISDCMDKIIEEAHEAKSAHTRNERVIEIMDVIQACETALRNIGLDDIELALFVRAHNAKDSERGYDKHEERTCTVDFSNYDELLDSPYTQLSCGHEVPMREERIKYCSECGAKAVSK